MQDGPTANVWAHAVRGTLAHAVDPGTCNMMIDAGARYLTGKQSLLTGARFIHDGKFPVTPGLLAHLVQHQALPVVEAQTHPPLLPGQHVAIQAEAGTLQRHTIGAARMCFWWLCLWGPACQCWCQPDASEVPCAAAAAIRYQCNLCISDCTNRGPAVRPGHTSGCVMLRGLMSSRSGPFTRLVW